MKNNLPLIVGIALPLAFIAVISAIVYLPSNFVNPKHNFIYTENAYGAYKNDVVVVGDKIAIRPSDYVKSMNGIDDLDYLENNPKIYLYDFSNESSHEITLEEAQQYLVERGPSSPDGYTIEMSYGHNGIFELFGSYDNNSGHFISSKDGSKKKLNGIATNVGYYGDLNVVAWIK